ncbi:hypothetical protein M9980_05055 [Sphingomonas donggukensis]|uniref:PRC-barrel domain-containing protein n=1 Tax=Sphingomonas donggukensis TaxID=2949093 RepID=A0ABY4TW10_9SPHN|nr:hypothetical protein [Sphingomonas donggukensis]URW76583.1 hypothetical protein M9980_05055 [Sphingomonas donggukensis]
MKFLVPALIIAATAAPAAVAQTGSVEVTPAAPAVGATVVDTTGATVGTIESISGAVAVINTGSAKVGYPLASMTPGPKGPIIALTKAALEASYAEQAAKAQADLQAKLVAGTAVRSLNGGTQVGTIKTADAEFVTLTTAKGDVRLPKSGFSLDAQGVIIGMTAEQFNAAISGAAAAK